MSMEFTLNDLQRQRVEDHLALVEQVLRRSIKTNETVDGIPEVWMRTLTRVCSYGFLRQAVMGTGSFSAVVTK